MNQLVTRVIDELRREKKMPASPDSLKIPVPAVNKVELYLSLNCNDRCPHCITDSGPDIAGAMNPDDAASLIRNLGEWSITRRLGLLFGPGRFRSPVPAPFRKLEKMKSPPKKLDDSLKELYSDSIQGKDRVSEWIMEDGSVELNFGRPSVRLSGGEFFMWPGQAWGRTLTVEERLRHQGKLINDIRKELPEYDIWILTNGRFATEREKTDAVLKEWARGGDENRGGGRTRVIISVDMFHRPPPGRTVEEMLEFIWKACRDNGLPAPFLYGIPNNRIGLLGRALRNFPAGTISRGSLENLSKSRLNPVKDVYGDPIDLMTDDGCVEVKGFFFRHGNTGILANNAVISPEGRLVFCCACLGDYGDFATKPEQSLRNMVTNPVSVMLRNSATAADLLNTAARLDPTITVLGSGKYAAVTGSTCYQMMTGERLPENRA